VAAPAGTFFFGPHPIHPEAGGGFCEEEGSHSHPYGIDPEIAYLYRQIADHQYFVGNVYEFGYQRAGFPYYGHHPLALGTDALYYCYIDGRHYHPFVPGVSESTVYVVRGGEYRYSGSFPSAYYDARRIYYRTDFAYRTRPLYRKYYRVYVTRRPTYARRASMTFLRQPPRGAARMMAPMRPSRPAVIRSSRPMTVARVRPTAPAPAPVRMSRPAPMRQPMRAAPAAAPRRPVFAARPAQQPARVTPAPSRPTRPAPVPARKKNERRQ
jgi:hypothetical protein